MASLHFVKPEFEHASLNAAVLLALTVLEGAKKFIMPLPEKHLL
jgi:hypothetical protein